MDEFKMCCGTTCDKRKVQEQIDALVAERDALAAQVEILGDKLSEVVTLLHVDGMTAVQWLLANCHEIEQLTNLEPEECLARVRAEAAKDGYIQGAAEYQESEDLRTDFDLHSRADKYAERVLKGEVE